jgi:transposase-like protein
MPERKNGRCCPRCHSERVHRSRARTLKEKSTKLIGAQKRRCHECGFDYFQLGSSVLVTKDLDRAARALMRYLAALFAMLVILWAIRWIIVRLAEPGPSG